MQWIPEAQIRFRNPLGQALLPRDMELLAAIAECHSISAASIRLGMSYKTAMRAIRKWNQAFESPLIESLSGGSSGGHTELTLLGKSWLEVHQSLSSEQQIQMLAMQQVMEQPERMAALERRPTVKLSARNQWLTQIHQIKNQGQQVRVELALPSGEFLWAAITRLSAEEMGLVKGQAVFAVIKAKSVKKIRAPKPITRSNCWPVLWQFQHDDNEWIAQLKGGLELVSTDITPSKIKTTQEMGFAYVAEDDVLIGMAW